MPKLKPNSGAGSLVELRALMACGEWRLAILRASAFPQIRPAARDRLLSAREAYLRPDFQRQLGRDPEELIQIGKQALLECYGEK
jgi:hypothetical protein